VKCRIKISSTNFIEVGECFDGPGNLDISLCGESNIKDYFLLLERSYPDILSTKYQKMQTLLGCSDETILTMLPKKYLSTSIDNTLNAIKDISDSKESKEYLITYLQIKGFLESLVRTSVNVEKINKLLNETVQPTVRNTIKGFIPENNNLCSKIIYSTIGTVTGRLTVIDGPRILTAPGKIKACFESSYRNGKVLQIDIKSAEPKFALQIKDDTVPDDVYLDISKNVLEDKITRKQAKQITLCALYGQSPAKLKNQLPGELDARTVIRQVRSYFGYYQLLDRLKQDHESNNFRNALGRPIRLSPENEHLLLSYYLQSSIAEGSILMFADFVNKFSDFCKPNFVIHDALILDCEESFANALLEKKSVNLLLGDWKFSAEVKDVRDI